MVPYEILTGSNGKVFHIYEIPFFHFSLGKQYRNKISPL